LLGEAVSVVQPEDRLRVPDVDCEQHSINLTVSDTAQRCQTRSVVVSDTATRCLTLQRSKVFFVRLRLADALGERLGSQRGLVALAAQLLDRHVAGREDLGARNDPRRPVLVPDPYVLELQMEERVRLLRDVGALELVAQICRILREHAVAEEAEDGLVLLLKLELEVGLVLVEIVQVRHAGLSVAGQGESGPPPFQGLPGPERARRGGRARTRARGVAGAGRAGRAGRGRASSGPAGATRPACGRSAARLRAGRPAARARGARFRLRPRR